MIYIHHHLGLGDHIVCNAIVRKFKKDCGKVRLAVKKHNYFSVKELYRDLDIQYHLVDTDADCIPEYFKCPTLRIGFEKCRQDWEKSFYDQVGMDYSERFKGFRIDRDYSREESLEDKLDLPDEFAFVNRSASTGIKEIQVETNLPIVELKPVTDSLFDWVGVLCKAREIHTIDSSIFQLIKQFNVSGRKFFYDLRSVDSSRTTPFFEDNTWTVL